jgi:hypothetical protein
MVDARLLIPPRNCYRAGWLHQKMTTHVVIIHPADGAAEFFLSYLRIGPVLRMVAGMDVPILASELPEMLDCITDVAGWEDAKWETLPCDPRLDRNAWLVKASRLLFDRRERKTPISVASSIFH